MTLLTAQGCEERKARLWADVPEDQDWLLVGDPRHICYLSGFWVNPLSFSNGERALLALERDGTSTLFSDNFTRRTAVCDPFVTDEVIEKWYDHKHSVANRDDALFDAFKDKKKQLHRKVCCTESESLSLLHSPYKTGHTDLGHRIRRLRRAKHSDEVELLKRCMRAGEAGHARALDVIRPGLTEFQLYREVQDAAQQAAGCPCLVYGDFRANSADMPKAGGLPTDHVLQDGELFILDYSVVIQGYRSDFTNTLAVGVPTAAQQQLFDTCLKAMEAAEGTLKAGAEAKAVYAAASQVLESGDFGALAHHAGHGLGLGHPEAPIFGPESTDTLVIGDVVTIEPGAYIQGIGGVRVEHNYLVTESGFEKLSDHKITLR